MRPTVFGATSANRRITMSPVTVLPWLSLPVMLSLRLCVPLTTVAVTCGLLLCTE